MQIRDVMSRDVKPASPTDTVQHAITDRDIAVRAVARGKAPDQCRVGDVMSPEIKYVYEDESVDDLVRNMSGLQLRRLPVLNRDKRLVGIVSLGDLAQAQKGKGGEALKGGSKA